MTALAFTPWPASTPRFEGIGGGVRAALLQPLSGVDIAESPDAYHITLALPGFDQRSLALELTGDVLTVQGRVEELEQQPRRRWSLGGRKRTAAHATVVEQVTLPGPVDAKHASAHYRDGILRIELPKLPVKGRRIPIRVGGTAGHQTHEGEHAHGNMPSAIRRLFGRLRGRRQ